MVILHIFHILHINPTIHMVYSPVPRISIRTAGGTRQAGASLGRPALGPAEGAGADRKDMGFPWGSSIQWIGLWENQQETSILHGKNMEKPWFPVDFPLNKSSVPWEIGIEPLNQPFNGLLQ